MCKYSIRTCTYKCFEIKRLIIPSIRDKYMDIVNVFCTGIDTNICNKFEKLCYLL